VSAFIVHRYRRIAHKSGQVYVLSAPETDFKHSSDVYETIAFQPEDSLAQEWHLVVIGGHYASCLICRERTHLTAKGENGAAMDNNRRFEGIWTSDRHVSQQAAQILLNHILDYRPELAEKIRRAQEEYLICELTDRDHQEEPDPFGIERTQGKTDQLGDSLDPSFPRSGSYPTGGSAEIGAGIGSLSLRGLSL